MKLGLLACAATAASAYGEPRIAVGGYAGSTSTTIEQSFDCPPTSDPASACPTSAEPHDGAHGVSLAAYVRYSLFRAVQLELNLEYSQKGYGGSDSVRIHYLEAPILLRLDPLPEASPARVFVIAGLAPALELGCHESGTRFDNDTRTSVPYSDACGSWIFFPRAPNRIDLGAVVGFGIGWRFPFGLVEVQARYVQGLVDNAAWGDGGETVNKAVYLLAGYGRTIAP